MIPCWWPQGNAQNRRARIFAVHGPWIPALQQPHCLDRQGLWPRQSSAIQYDLIWLLLKGHMGIASLYYVYDCICTYMYMKLYEYDYMYMWTFWIPQDGWLPSTCLFNTDNHHFTYNYGPILLFSDDRQSARWRLWKRRRQLLFDLCLPAYSILYKFDWEVHAVYKMFLEDFGRSKATKSWRRPDSGFWHHVNLWELVRRGWDMLRLECWKSMNKLCWCFPTLPAAGGNCKTGWCCYVRRVGNWWECGKRVVDSQIFASF